jgi:hypothetical protein
MVGQHVGSESARRKQQYGKKSVAHIPSFQAGGRAAESTSFLLFRDA